MLENMILIVFAITVWEFKDPITNSIFSCSLIILSYFGNLYRVTKTKMKVKKARIKRKLSENKEV